MPLRDSLAALFRPSGSRLRPVAGFRAISILMVMAFHTLFVVHFLFDDARFVAFMLAAPGWIGPVANGDKAVDAFFVLSGFLLTGALLRRQGEPAGRYYWRFWRGRLYRIVPVFWLALFLYAFAAWDGRALTLLANLLFVDNILPGTGPIIPVGWSLAIEMQFCLVLPLLLRLAGERLVPVTLALIGAGLALKAALVLTEPLLLRESLLAILAGDRSSLFTDRLYYPTWARFEPLLVGVLAAWALARHAGRVERRAPVLLWSGLALAAAGLAWPDYRTLDVPPPALNAALLVLHRPVFALGIAFLLLAALVPARGPAARAVHAVLAWRHWQSWSEMVFPLYLFHFPMIAVAAVLVFGTTDKNAVEVIGVADLLAIFALGAAMSWIICLPVHLFLERPMHDRGRRDPFGGGERPASAGAGRNLAGLPVRAEGPPPPPAKTGNRRSAGLRSAPGSAGSPAVCPPSDP